MSMAYLHIIGILLVSNAVVLVGGSKITCTADKKPNPIGVMAKFAKCTVHFSKSEGKAGRCILETISKPIDYKKSIVYLKSVLPDKQSKTVEKDLAHCAPKFKDCKDSKADPEGTSCTPASNCFMGYFNKMCK